MGSRREVLQMKRSRRLAGEFNQLHRYGLCLQEFLDAQTDIAGYLPQQRWGDVASFVERHRRSASVGMAELLVGTALSDFNKSESGKDGHDLARLENRNGHGSIYLDSFGAHKLRIERRLTVFEKHRNHFAHVVSQLFQGSTLGVCAGKPGTEPT